MALPHRKSSHFLGRVSHLRRSSMPSGTSSLLTRRLHLHNLHELLFPLLPDVGFWCSDWLIPALRILRKIGPWRRRGYDSSPTYWRLSQAAHFPISIVSIFATPLSIRTAYKILSILNFHGLSTLHLCQANLEEQPSYQPLTNPLP
jgi:hypothetical protein